MEQVADDKATEDDEALFVLVVIAVDVQSQTSRGRAELSRAQVGGRSAVLRADGKE